MYNRCIEPAVPSGGVCASSIRLPNPGAGKKSCYRSSSQKLTCTVELALLRTYRKTDGKILYTSSLIVDSKAGEIIRLSRLVQLSPLRANCSENLRKPIQQGTFCTPSRTERVQKWQGSSSKHNFYAITAVRGDGSLNFGILRIAMTNMQSSTILSFLRDPLYRVGET